MRITPYNEWLLEAKAAEEYVNATVTQNVQGQGLKKGDVVKVDALQYTKSGNSDEVEIVISNGKKLSIDKKFLDVKI